MKTRRRNTRRRNTRKRNTRGRINTRRRDTRRRNTRKRNNKRGGVKYGGYLFENTIKGIKGIKKKTKRWGNTWRFRRKQDLDLDKRKWHEHTTKSLGQKLFNDKSEEAFLDHLLNNMDKMKTFKKSDIKGNSEKLKSYFYKVWSKIKDDFKSGSVATVGILSLGEI